jgi:hypothetical protein
MQLFNLFKKKNEDISQLSVKEQLSYLIDYIPDFYKDQREYLYATNYLKHDEWGLSLESLIELAVETDHYFSEEYWQRLADTANSMSLSELSNYCLKQIEHNQKDLKSITPFGWTTIKFDDNHFQHYISEKIKENWVAKRHQRDNVNSLLKKENGVYLKMNGRSGTIYVIDQDRLAEVDVEIGMSGLLLYFNNTTHWILPLKQALTIEEKQIIRTSIISWASKTKNSVEFDD